MHTVAVQLQCWQASACAAIAPRRVVTYIQQRRTLCLPHDSCACSAYNSLVCVAQHRLQIYYNSSSSQYYSTLCTTLQSFLEFSSSRGQFNRKKVRQVEGGSASRTGRESFFPGTRPPIVFGAVLGTLAPFTVLSSANTHSSTMYSIFVSNINSVFSFFAGIVFNTNDVNMFVIEPRLVL